MASSPAPPDPQDSCILARMSTPVWIYDIDHRCITWGNAAALDFWGKADLRALVDDSHSMQLTEGTKRRLEGYRSEFQKGRTVVERWTLYPTDRQPVPVVLRCRGIPVRKSGETSQGMLVEAHSMEERSQPETRLLEALRHVEEQIMLHSTEGEVLVRNPAALQTFATATEGSGDHFQSIFATAEVASAAREQAFADAVFRDEVLVNTLDGPRWHDVEVRRVVDPLTGDNALLSCHHDTHERYVLTSRLRELKAKAEAVSYAKSEFLAVVSHELRTPMTGVLAAARLLQDSPLNDGQKEALEMVFSAGNQMLTLIDELLDLGRVEVDQLVCHLEPSNIASCLKASLGGCLARAASEGRVLNADIDESVPPVLCDSARINQIVSNLVSNALKFSTTGDIRVGSKWAYSEHDRQRIVLKISVSDRGIGMTNLQRDRVFDAFVQADASRARRRGGLGIGLYISRRWARAMGGDLTVVSEPGVGSTFELVVPADVVQSKMVSKAPNPLRDRSLPMQVLVVDDNVLNLRAFERALRRWGCLVTTAVDGVEALASIAEDPPDAVLMDIQMPELDGVETTRRLRDNARTRDLPVIALTADAYFRDSPSYTEVGFDAFVLKPIAWGALHDTLAEFSPRGEKTH